MTTKLAPFRAWDGEGLEPLHRGGPQRYALLASESFYHLWNPQGIPTLDALSWIVDHAHAERPSIQIAFGTTYDVNMILADLDPQEVALLYAEGDRVFVLEGEPWRVQWIPRNRFNVQHPDGRWAHTYDVFAFFQSSFVAALRRWGIEVPEWLVEMKERRGTFFGGHEYELKAYAEEECRLLCEIMEQVRQGLRSAGVVPRSWHGAGAVSSALLGKYEVKKYVGRGSRRPAIQEPIMRAYFGGRAELFRQGEFSSAAQYDVNSAYAAALRHLPDGRGKWRRSTSYEYDGKWNPWGLWRVSWEVHDGDELLMPLPFRSTTKAIHYPTRGEGWYHSLELKAALRHFGDSIRVHEGLVFEPESSHKPFQQLVDDGYELRRQLHSQGDPTEHVVKYGLAAVWGKLSQSISFGGKVPPYQDYFWSGATTAMVRAWMLEIAAEHRERLIQINTDGVLLEGTDGSPLDEHLGPGLGELRRTDMQEVFVAQSGMMSSWDAESGAELIYTRGFFAHEVDFEKLRAVWRRHGPRGSLTTKGVRFHGIGSCMAEGDFRHWRKWRPHTERLNLFSVKKFYWQLGGQPGGSYTLLPPLDVQQGLSCLYEPRRTFADAVKEDAEWVQGTEQPLAVF